MKVLILTAHPDDAEMNCGGTIAKYIQEGHEVHCIQACSGDKGNFTLPREEMAQIRKKESEKAAEVAGAYCENLGVPDGELLYNQEFLHMFVTAMRKVAPDIVITHTPEDYHPDHVACAKIVIDASFLISVPSVFPDSQAVDKVPQIFFMEPYTGIGFVPEEFVDISGFLEQKLKMMRCHQSQIKWLYEHDHLDILEYIVTSSKYRGFQCGVRYAEGFIRYRTALRVNPGKFLP